MSGYLKTDDKTIPVTGEDLTTLEAQCDDEFKAGIHNSIYRGKKLDNFEDYYDVIDSGQFTDLYIGDYVTIDDINYRIAAFDYWWNNGDTGYECLTHHLVIVPDTYIGDIQQMNSSNTTSGGYTGSALYSNSSALHNNSTIVNAFGSSILNHREYLTTAVTSGYPSAEAWADSTIEIMNEEMVYGSVIRQQMPAGGTNVYTYTIDKSQLPLFGFRHDLICIRKAWWLRDIVTAAYFALVNAYGLASGSNASGSCGVRPAFGICAS